MANMIRTDKLWVNSMIGRAEDVDEIINEFAEKMQMSDRVHLRMRLLVEETMGMARSSLKNFEGELWLEGDNTGYRIILEADVREHEYDVLPAVGTPTGFMAKIAEMLNCSYVFDDASALPDNLRKMLPNYISYGMVKADDTHVWAGEWSLVSYRYSLEKNVGDPETELVFDELEKSIVAQIADNVTVGIYGQKIRLAIYKNL